MYSVTFFWFVKITLKVKLPKTFTFTMCHVSWTQHYFCLFFPFLILNTFNFMSQSLICVNDFSLYDYIYDQKFSKINHICVFENKLENDPFIWSRMSWITWSTFCLILQLPVPLNMLARFIVSWYAIVVKTFLTCLVLTVLLIFVYFPSELWNKKLLLDKDIISTSSWKTSFFPSRVFFMKSLNVFFISLNYS